MKIRCVFVKEYADAEIYELERIIKIKEVDQGWKILIAPVPILEPGEPDKPLHPSEP